MTDPNTREALAEVLMQIYDHGTQPNAFREADAILSALPSLGYRPAHEVAEPVPYLPPDLYNDLQDHLLSARSGDAGLFLANRLMEATGASELRRRQRDRAAFPAPTEGTTRVLLTHPHDGHGASETCLTCTTESKEIEQ